MEEKGKAKQVILPRRSSITFTKDEKRYDEIIKSYWLYYLELENDFLDTKKYVEFNPVNYYTYSLEYLKLYQTVCSEIDVVGKEMAYAANPKFKIDDKGNNIYKWWYEIEDSFQTSTNNECPKEYRKSPSLLRQKSVKLLNEWPFSPWKDFDVEMVRNTDKNGTQRNTLRLSNNGKTKVPAWWTAYNKVKHHRTSSIDGKNNQTNFIYANLYNLSNAFAALFILEKSFLEEIGTEGELKDTSNSKLFENDPKSITLIVE